MKTKTMTRGAGLVLLPLGMAALAAGQVHVWEKQELTFTAAGSYANPYSKSPFGWT